MRCSSVYFCSGKTNFMRAEIITIGDEILIGQIVDTNSAWIAQELNGIGIKVHQITSVSDSEEHIIATLNEAAARVQLILITGGLGPTKDDITKKTLCKFFNTHLVFDEASFINIERLFKMRGRDVTNANRPQAEVPVNCTPLHNENGTAPGMWFEEKGKVFVSMPGVPYEMKTMMTEEVLPRLKKHFETPFIMHRTVLTQGVGETILEELVSDVEDTLPQNFKLAYLPQAGMVRLRLSARGEEQTIRSQMKEEFKKICDKISDYIFGYDEETLEGVVGNLLRERKLKVSTAESCTGGYVAHLITSVPGSSEYYMGSTITYSYESKTDLLNVPAELIKQKGAVSEEVVCMMAENVKKKFNTACAIATSGVAGPAGGTPDKPVGTVWVAVSTPKGTITKKLLLGNHRLRIIHVAAISALNLLRKELLI